MYFGAIMALDLSVKLRGKSLEGFWLYRVHSYHSPHKCHKSTSRPNRKKNDPILESKYHVEAKLYVFGQGIQNLKTFGTRVLVFYDFFINLHIFALRPNFYSLPLELLNLVTE